MVKSLPLGLHAIILLLIICLFISTDVFSDLPAAEQPESRIVIRDESQPESFAAKLANNGTWWIIENRYFSAIVNTGSEFALKRMNDLERFRAAAEQITTVKLPKDYPPAVVIIFEESRHFDQYTYVEGLRGYMVSMGSGPLFVTSSAFIDLDAKQVLRHEYVHVLTAMREFRYPLWYREGIAEVLSTSEIKDNHITFLPPWKRLKAIYSGDDFNRIIDDDFDPHKDFSRADSYIGYWLLVHYLMFNEEKKPQLEECLRLYNSGMSSKKSFKRAFGMSANKMWRKELKKYSDAIPIFKAKLKTNSVEDSYSMTIADPSEIETLLIRLEQIITSIKADSGY